VRINARLVRRCSLVLSLRCTNRGRSSTNDWRRQSISGTSVRGAAAAGGGKESLETFPTSYLFEIGIFENVLLRSRAERNVWIANGGKRYPTPNVYTKLGYNPTDLTVSRTRVHYKFPETYYFRNRELDVRGWRGGGGWEERTTIRTVEPFRCHTRTRPRVFAARWITRQRTPVWYVRNNRARKCWEVTSRHWSNYGILENRSLITYRFGWRYLTTGAFYTFYGRINYGCPERRPLHSPVSLPTA